MNNYFEIEPLIIARLKAEVAEFKDVIGVAGIVNDDPAAFCPIAQIMNGGFSIKDSTVKQNLITQKWIIAVIVAAPNDKDGIMARAEAGPLMVKTAKALRGWTPATGYSPLVMSRSQGDLYTDDGIAIFPLEFTTNVSI